MKQCNECRSYAVNIERDVSDNKCLCDVCHWKRRYEEAAEAMKEFKRYGAEWTDQLMHHTKREIVDILGAGLREKDERIAALERELDRARKG
jgi:hypothetical protein